MKFKAPISVITKILYGISIRLLSGDELRSKTMFASHNEDYPVPYLWQSVVQYLYKKRLLKVPRFVFEQVPAGEFTFWPIRLFAKADAQETAGKVNFLGGYSRGVSFDLEEALSKSVGELLERQPQSAYQDEQFIKASSVQLQAQGINHVLPRECMTLDGPADLAESVFRWERVKSLLGNQSVYMPAQLTRWNYRFLTNEPVLRDVNTAGSAGYFTQSGAITRGLFELLERDAFLHTWLTKTVPEQIATDTIVDAETTAVIEHYKKKGVTLQLLDITNQSQLPTIALMAVDVSGDGPAITVTAGTGSTINAAMTQSIKEFLGIRLWQLETIGSYREVVPIAADSFKSPATVVDRMRIWSNVCNVHNIDWLLSGPKLDLATVAAKHEAISDLNELELRTLVIKNIQQSFEVSDVYVAMFEQPVLQTLGYHSVRVMVPELLPMYFNEAKLPTQSKRLRQSSVLNSDPHPFP